MMETPSTEMDAAALVMSNAVTSAVVGTKLLQMYAQRHVEMVSKLEGSNVMMATGRMGTDAALNAE
jgi:hypothetical protein